MFSAKEPPLSIGRVTHLPACRLLARRQVRSAVLQLAAQLRRVLRVFFMHFLIPRQVTKNTTHHKGHQDFS